MNLHGLNAVEQNVGSIQYTRTMLQLTIIWISNKMIIRRYLTDDRESFVAFQNNMVIAGVNSITRAIICSVPSYISKLREVPICQITAPLLL